MQKRWMISLLAAGALAMGAGAARADTGIAAGCVAGAAGATALPLSVTLTVTAPDQVAGSQNDMTFSGGAIVAAKANGKPDCTVNPDIDKTATSFAFQPAGCSAAAGTCTGVRGIVLSTDNTDAIPSGSTLYTCKVNIAAGTANGTLPIVVSKSIASTPTGGRINIADNAANNGSVAVGTGAVCGAVGSTPTPTSPAVGASATPTSPAGGPTATPAPPAGTGIAAGCVAGPAGSNALSLAVTLTVVAPDAVAGSQNDMTFSGGASVAAKANGKPDCTVNPDIDKTATSFAFQPAGCTVAAGTCTGVRGIVLSTDNTDAIPSGSQLYTCKVNIAAGTADGTLPIVVSKSIASTPTGGRINIADSAANNGRVVVGATATCEAVATPTSGPGGGSPTPTTSISLPSVTPTTRPPASATPTTRPVGGTATATVAPTKTATSKPPATATSGPGTVPTLEDDGGCQINMNGTHSSGWLLLIPAAALLLIRRRTR